MDNGPARKHNIASRLQKAGEKVSDMAEVLVTQIIHSYAPLEKG